MQHGCSEAEIGRGKCDLVLSFGEAFVRLAPCFSLGFAAQPRRLAAGTNPRLLTYSWVSHDLPIDPDLAYVPKPVVSVRIPEQEAHKAGVDVLAECLPRVRGRVRTSRDFRPALTVVRDLDFEIIGVVGPIE